MDYITPAAKCPKEKWKKRDDAITGWVEGGIEGETSKNDKLECRV